jgi:hypothetical protein
MRQRVITAPQAIPFTQWAEHIARTGPAINEGTNRPDEVSVYLVLSAALGPGFYSAPNTNEYQISE